MKKLTMVLAIAAMGILLVSFASAQPTSVSATQTFNLAVSEIYKIAVSGSPSNMTITDAVPGSDPTPVTNNSTTFSTTHNDPDGALITASLAPALVSGYNLTIALDGGGAVDISDAESHTVVANVAAGVLTGEIAYEFSATAAAGPLASVGETVTLTLTSK